MALDKCLIYLLKEIAVSLHLDLHQLLDLLQALAMVSLISVFREAAVLWDDLVISC
jgi:hypothetical protein